MNRPSFIIANGDLILLFIYGASLCYFDSYIFKIPSLFIISTALLVSFILGSFGPSLSEVIEWVLFFCLGIFVIRLYPYLKLYQSNNEELDLKQIIFIFKNSILYSTHYLLFWLIGIPVGYLFYRFTRVPYYRSNF